MCLGQKFGVRCCVARRCKFGNAQHSNEFSVAKWCLRAKQSVATLQIQHGENGAVFGRGTSLSLSLSLSLVARTFWHAFRLNLKGFFTHFIVVLTRFIVDFARFIAISSYFVVVFSHLFACKRHFLGHCAFFENFKCFVFLGFLHSLLQAVFAKTAHFIILSLLQKGEKSTL